MKEQLILDFNETTQELLSTLYSFRQEKFNKIPFEGSWTAGQVAEHLFKSESNIPNVLKGNSKTTGRNPFEKAPIIESVFLDFSKKLQSPEFILPSPDPKGTHVRTQRRRSEPHRCSAEGLRLDSRHWQDGLLRREQCPDCRSRPSCCREAAWSEGGARGPR